MLAQYVEPEAAVYPFDIRSYNGVIMRNHNVAHFTLYHTRWMDKPMFVAWKKCQTTGLIGLDFLAYLLLHTRSDTLVYVCMWVRVLLL